MLVLREQSRPTSAHTRVRPLWRNWAGSSSTWRGWCVCETKNCIYALSRKHGHADGVFLELHPRTEVLICGWPLFAPVVQRQMLWFALHAERYLSCASHVVCGSIGAPPSPRPEPPHRFNHSQSEHAEKDADVPDELLYERSGYLYTITQGKSA